MCGIVGYIGNKSVVPVLMAGLKRLEYRGYDSAGLAVLKDDRIQVVKESGKLAALDAKINKINLDSTIGIGHTRWATHGEPNQNNAHPHIDTKGNIALIHNGIIENYATLRKMLTNKGHIFKTDTDTEVASHLIEEFYDGDFESAFHNALAEIEGTYGFAVISRHDPDKIYVARQGSPLVVGLGDNEYFLASDVSAIVAHTRSVFYLEDGETAILSRDGIITKSRALEIVDKDVEEITFDISQIEKSGYPHYMLKEIFEQTNTIQDAFRGRLIASEGKVKLGGLDEVMDRLEDIERIIFLACGTSWHAALIGEYRWKWSMPLSSDTEIR